MAPISPADGPVAVTGCVSTCSRIHTGIIVGQCIAHPHSRYRRVYTLSIESTGTISAREYIGALLPAVQTAAFAAAPSLGTPMFIRANGPVVAPRLGTSDHMSSSSSFRLAIMCAPAFGTQATLKRSDICAR